MIKYKLNNGNTYNIFNNNDLFSLIEQELGTEIANRIEEDYEDFEMEIKENEKYNDELLAERDYEISNLQNEIKDLEEEIRNLQEELDRLKGE